MGRNSTAGDAARRARVPRMKIPDVNRLYIGPRLTVGFVVIILLMLGADGFLLWQFHTARVQADRLAGVSQELIAVVRLQTALLSFDDNLDKLTQSEDVERLSREAGPLRAALLEGTQQTRNALKHLPSGIHPDPTILPTVEAIESALPSQLEAIAALATSNDWKAMRLRLANQKKPLESQALALVKSINETVREELAKAVVNIGHVQRRMLLILPITALFSLLIAAFLGLVITRSITEPLGRLVEGSRALARGEFTHQVSVIGQDELAQLGQVFNLTAERLQSLYETLQKREAYLAEAQRLSHAGSWAWNVGTKQLFWSEENLRIFGLDPNTSPTPEIFLERVHADDRASLKPVEAALLAGHDAEYNYRIVLPDQSIKYVRSVAHPVTDDLGRVTEFVGTVIDVTEQRRARAELEKALEEIRERTAKLREANEALRRSEAYLLEAQRLSHTGSWTHDALSGTVTTSTEVLRIFDVKSDEDASTVEFFFGRIHPEDRPLEAQNYEKARVSKSAFESEYRIVLRDGSIRQIHNIGHPILDGSGELVAFVGTAMDVTEERVARAKLEKAFEEIKHLRDRLHDENLALREQIDQAFMFEEIVGSSLALQGVLSGIVKVAPTDSTVLIIGETGTGKELIARAVHKHSHRSGQAFISVNCASIPSTLIASELFGHEKGAFTGALQRRQGRFELAHSGTIFLDEIGELPPETQIALLRVLQERQFERVGGTRVFRTDVRVIAATNRDLPAAVSAGTFRADLFYRLNVFPIEVPPLRQRKEDIPLLVEYFVKRYAEKLGKQIRSIDKKTLELCEAYPWPGNIRELQNIVERSVILCTSETFSVDSAWLSTPELHRPEVPGPLTETLQQQERELIEAALARSKGRVAGPGGAAAKLGIPRSTLDWKIQQLKINKHKFASRP
jgi:PAS domain S-box-containing protein